MKVEIYPYHPLHAQLIADEIKMKKHDDFSQWILDLKRGGPGYTLMIDDQVACCAGILLLGWQRGEAWLIFGLLAFLHMKTTFGLIKKYFDEIIQEKELKRVQATVRWGDESGERFVEHLGFEKEGLLRKFGPSSEDMTMYARIF